MAAYKTREHGVTKRKTEYRVVAIDIDEDMSSGEIAKMVERTVRAMAGEGWTLVSIAPLPVFEPGEDSGMLVALSRPKDDSVGRLAEKT